MAKTRRQSEEAGRNGSDGQGNAVYFLSLTLSGVRCFGAEPQKLDLSRGGDRPARWTIILGENGTGKTTALQVLAGIEPVSIFAGRRILSGEPKAEHLAPRLLTREFFGANPHTNDLLRSEDREGVIETTLAQGGGFAASGGKWQARSLRLGIGFNAWSCNGDFGSEEGPKCYGYGASRRLSVTQLSEAPESGAADSLFDDDCRLRNAEEWLLQVDYSASKESPVQEKWQRLRGLVKDVLLKILPDDVKDLRISEPDSARPARRVEFRTEYGWVGLRSLGHGYRTLIAWVVDLASRLCERAPDSLTPLDQPAVVLIDEIDLHLHPVWQRKLMSHLSRCFPNAQFIVTAHSPLIVQAAGDDANVALLHREGDHVVIENNLERIRGWRVDQLLTSDLFNLPSARPPQLDELFARRKELLQKKKLTKEDRAELARIEEQLGPLPTSETSEVIELMADLQQTLGKLGGQQDKAQ
jgi:predicted ATPase